MSGGSCKSGYLGLGSYGGGFRRGCGCWCYSQSSRRWDGRSEEEALDLAIGHGCLHQLLTGARDDSHTLGDDLQLALRLPLTLDHHCQARVSSLCTLC